MTNDRTPPKRPGLTEEIREKFRQITEGEFENFKLGERHIEIIWNNYYDPENILTSRANGFQSATEGGGGIVYLPHRPRGLVGPENNDCDNMKAFNPFAKRKEVADAESRLVRILNKELDDFPERTKEKLKRYQDADPSTFEYQVYHFPPFVDYMTPMDWRDKRGMINYRELIDRIVGPKVGDDTNGTTPPPVPPPNSYFQTEIKVDKEFTIQGVVDGPDANQVTLKLDVFGYTIEGIGGANYDYVVINHRGQKEIFSAGNSIKVVGIEMGPDKTYISYTSDHSRTTLNILDYYGQVELVDSNDSSSAGGASAFEIIFNGITNDANLQKILNQANVVGDFFLNSIAGRENNFVNGDGVTINYEEAKKLLGITTQQKTKTISEIRNELINEIKAVLSRSPTLSNSDLPSDYQNWQEQIEKLDSEPAIKTFRDAILVVIKTKRANREESQKLDEGLDQANSPDATDEQRADILKNSGNLIGKETSEQKTKIEQIEDELAKNPAKLREAIEGLLTKQMTDQKVKAEELIASKAEWEQLKTELNPAKIKNIKQKVSEEVGNKGAEKKITNFTNQIKTVLKSKDQKEIKQLKDQLIEFINSPSTFYQTQKSEAQKLLDRLENIHQDGGKPTTNPGGFPWKIVVPIILLVVLVVVVAVVMVRKKKRIRAK